MVWPSALLHFCVIELSPIWLSYASMRSFLISCVDKKREHFVTLLHLADEVYRAKGSSNYTENYTLFQLHECLVAGVQRDLWKTPAQIAADRDICGNLEIGRDFRSKLYGTAGLLHMQGLSFSVLAFVGCLVVFVCHGGLTKGRDWKSGHYIAFTWALRLLKSYHIIVGAYVIAQVTVCVIALTVAIRHQGGSAIMHSWPTLLIICISLFHLVIPDEPPVKYDSDEFRNTTFTRPWYKFYQSNSKFCVRGLGGQWLQMHGKSAGDSAYLEGQTDVGKMFDCSAETDTDGTDTDVASVHSTQFLR
eukprot:TRINITY_DN31599_c0_g1_i1.p1 TRINITY_DN31599_c0_g1~~TRINITY_DN31599_c0_g1_i1.p1  ORF type:complete len:304 (+),score=20.72 TRINITY_DN31599_c0_g1_i1:49-960(+)